MSSCHPVISLFSKSPDNIGVEVLWFAVHGLVLPLGHAGHGVGLHVQLAGKLEIVVKLHGGVALKVVVKTF